VAWPLSFTQEFTAIHRLVTVVFCHLVPVAGLSATHEGHTDDEHHTY
jgi:hypothetical protein